jgi:hypothetical protein
MGIISLLYFCLFFWFSQFFFIFRKG